MTIIETGRYAVKHILRCLRTAAKRFRMLVWNFCRRHRNRKYRKRFNNPGVSIISQNCLGGVLSHDLGVQFRSPTINLWMEPDHFLRFCENLPYYLSLTEMTPCTDADVLAKLEGEYPVAWLDDVRIHLMHYKSVEEGNRIWQRRKGRVDPENLVILAMERDGMTVSMKDRFERLPYRKVMFTHVPDSRHPHCVCIPGYEGQQEVGRMMMPTGLLGKRPVDAFDWVAFLNGTGL